MTFLTKTQNGVEVPLSDEEIADFKDRELKHQDYLKNVKYLDDRMGALPSYQDFLIMMWEAMDNGTIPKDNKFYPMIKDIYEKYPKP